jgi:hypothetical protein
MVYVILYILFVAAFTIGVLVFSIQSLIVGIATYQVPFPNTDGFPENCQSTVGLWLLVYGSIGLIEWAHSFCRGFCSGKKGGWKMSVLLSRVTALFLYCWVCYGFNIWIYPEHYPGSRCSPSQYRVFSIVVLFDLFATIIYVVSSHLGLILFGRVVRQGHQHNDANNLNLVGMQLPNNQGVAQANDAPNNANHV